MLWYLLKQAGPIVLGFVIVMTVIYATLDSKRNFWSVARFKKLCAFSFVEFFLGVTGAAVTVGIWVGQGSLANASESLSHVMRVSLSVVAAAAGVVFAIYASSYLIHRIAVEDEQRSGREPAPIDLPIPGFRRVVHGTFTAFDRFIDAAGRAEEVVRAVTPSQMRMLRKLHKILGDRAVEALQSDYLRQLEAMDDASLTPAKRREVVRRVNEAAAVSQPLEALFQTADVIYYRQDEQYLTRSTCRRIIKRSKYLHP